MAPSAVACQKSKRGQRINENYTTNLTTPSSLIKQFPSVALKQITELQWPGRGQLSKNCPVVDN